MKKQFGIRIEESLIDRAKKLAEKNKKNFQHPQNYNLIIEDALSNYLQEKEKRKSGGGSSL